MEKGSRIMRNLKERLPPREKKKVRGHWVVIIAPLGAKLLSLIKLITARTSCSELKQTGNSQNLQKCKRLRTKSRCYTYSHWWIWSTVVLKVGSMKQSQGH